MAPIFVVLAGAVVMDVIDHIVRSGAFERRVSLAGSLRAVPAIKVAGVAAATG